jgi:hypothetical protein
MWLCQGLPLTRVRVVPFVSGSTPTGVGSESRLGKARLGQHCLALRREDVVDEGLR